MKSIFKIVSGVASVAMMFCLAGCRSSKPEPNPYTGLMSSRSNVPPASREVSKISKSAPAAVQDIFDDNSVVAPGIGGPEDSFEVNNIPAEITELPIEPLEEAPAPEAPAPEAPARRTLPSVPNGNPIVEGAAVSTSTNVYIVKKGDYISKIAKNLGIKTSDLKAANPQVKNFERIIVGQKLNLPAGVSVSDNVSSKKLPSTGATAPVGAVEVPADGIYTVVSGDSISKIAKRFGVKNDDIRRWNDLSSDKLMVGQTLRVKGEAAQKMAESTAPKAAEPSKDPAAAAEPPAAATDAPAANNDDAPVVDDIGGADALPPAEGIPESAPANSTFPQLIMSGDTLESIAGLYDTTVEALLEANPQIKGNEDLKPGESIMIKMNK